MKRAEPELSAIEQMAAAADAIRTLVELAAGHRQTCLAAGFSETAAEQMAVALHGCLCINAFNLGGKT